MDIGAFVDLSGNEYGRWHVDSYAGNSMWNCTCKCGNKGIIKGYTLTKGKSTSCGCYRKELHSVPQSEMLKKTFGRLTVESLNKIIPQNGAIYNCLCSCGNKVIVSGRNLRNGNVKSCGCLCVDANKINHTKRIKYQIDKLVGKKFGRLLVNSLNSRTGHSILWNCICDCGNVTIATTSSLTTGEKQSCGCLQKEICGNRSHERAIDITGLKRNMFMVTGNTRMKNGKTLWECVCNCGNYFEDTAANLLNRRKNCGCTISTGEYLLSKELEKRKIQYKKNYKFNDLYLKSKDHPLMFDFGILNEKKELKYLIEFQGIQHYKDFGWFGKQQREITDPMKKEYCKEHNIPLYEIRYDEDIKTALEKIIYQETVHKKAV